MSSSNLIARDLADSSTLDGKQAELAAEAAVGTSQLARNVRAPIGACEAAPDSSAHAADTFAELLSACLQQHLDQQRAELFEEIKKLRNDFEALRAQCRGERRCLTVSEACERYGFSRSTWDRYLANRANGLWALLEPWRVGQRLRVPVKEFEGWWTSPRRHSAFGPPLAGGQA